jgi:ELWxxDGT repeat protein
MAGSVFFTADDHTHGRELWTSDSAGTGATRVRDIAPGEYDSEPTELTVAGDKLFFFAGDGTHGRELWVSGGDEGSTHLVKDVQPGVRTEGPSSLTAVGDTVFFDPDDGVHDGPTLWSSDGTEAGTAFVADVDPFAGEEEYLSSVRPVVAGGSLFFVADDPAHGLELWSSDGSEAGTAMVKDIRPGSYGSYASYLVESGGKVFLTARDGTHGPEVWVSDGTAPGTSLVQDVNPGVGNRSPSWLTDVGGTLFFAEGDGVHGVELWKTNGTGAATLLVKDVNLGGGFTIAKTGVPNTSTGTMRVKVTVKGPGRLLVGPVGTSPLRTSAQDVASAGAVTVTLRPTEAGMRTLRRNGSLRVTARFTFTPCGGSGTSQVRSFVLHLG